MHELAIANSVLESARKTAAEHQRPLRRIGLRIGEWAGVDAEALRAGFELLVRDTEAARVELEIERSGSQHELQLVYVELEEP